MLTLWLVCDGKAGDRVQLEGVGAAIAERLPTETRAVTIAPRHPWDWLAPFGPPDPRERPGADGSPLARPFPDIVIATGRRAVPIIRAFTRFPDPRPTTAFLKHTRTAARVADLVWTPAHDLTTSEESEARDDRLATLTGPHPYGAARLAALRRSLPPAIADAPRPRFGVILGGPSGATRFDAADIAALATSLARLSATAGSTFLVASRRTPPELLAAARAALPGAHGDVGAGKNPYPAVLAGADAFLVTGDSHNMVSEALATGAPVHVFRPRRLALKLARFLDRLQAEGLVESSTAPLATDPRPSLDATGGIADAILAAHRRRLGR